MQYAETSKVSTLPTISETLTGFWSLWTARVLWLLAILLAVWGTTEGAIPLEIWIAVAIGVLVQLLFFVAAMRHRVPRWHTWATALVALSIVALTWSLVPASEYPLLLLAPIVLLDVARSYGWLSLLLLVIFPFAPMLFTNLFQSGRIALDPQVWGFWVIAVGVAVTLVRPFDLTGRKPRPTRGDILQGVLANTIKSFSEATDRDQIFSILMRGGVDALDYSRRRQPSRAFILTFREGLQDLLQISAVQNLEPSLIGTVYELKGVLSTFVQEGAAFDMDVQQSPFEDVRSLRDHRILLIPLRAGLDLYGAVLFATKDELRAEDEEIQRTLLGLVNQASLVLHNRVLQFQLQGGRQQRMEDEGELRHQLARDLHDGPVQRVAAISMQLEFIKVLFEKDPKRAADELARAQQVAKLAAQEMRTMLFALRPVVLESSGLKAGLEALVKRLNEQDKVAIDMVADPLPRLDSKVEETAFAILQEAITNARKYSKGAPIHVRLIQGEALIVGQVEDEGPGFDLQTVMSNYATKASLGLLNMQERASLVGGQLKIDTAVGKGTLISLAIPMNSNGA
jgi:signal transduction histidine kinase